MVVDVEMFRYFGFGSNMNLASLRAKGVEPFNSQPAALPGWRLRFNVQHFFRNEGGVGNIETSPLSSDKVLGVLHECPDEALTALDAAEAYGHGYDRIEVDVESGPLGSDPISALTYVGMPEFIDNNCRPSRRYLNIIVAGAREADLDATYIQELEQQPVHQVEDYPLYTPPTGNFPTFDKHSLAKHPLYTAIMGAVFDMSQARPLHEFLKGFFGGQDMTLFHLQRLDSSDGTETLDDIRKGNLSSGQQRYLNDYLNEYAREYRYVGNYSYSDTNPITIQAQ